MDEGFSLWEAAKWVVTGLAGVLLTLLSRLWRKQEADIETLKREHAERMDEMQAACRQHAHDLTAHAVGDAAAHEKIKGDLASAIDRLNTKIDDRTDALGKQITEQHGMLAKRIDRVLELFVEGRQ